jgi:putative transcriptional regulator
MESLINTKFQVLVEIAAHQPNVRQADIAAKLNITPQAVSEYVKQLLSEGYVSSEGPLNYKATKEGVEEIIRSAQDIKGYTRFVLEEVVKEVRVFTAIAAQDLRKGQRVKVWMKNGLLYAGEKPDSKAGGITIRDAEKGQDVGIKNLEGMIQLETGVVTICKIPRTERGGSENLDYGKLKREVRGRKFLCALGVEALIALRKINKKTDAFFGVKEAVVEAAHHGIYPLVVGVDDELPELLRRLEDEEIPFNIVDVSLIP